MRIALRTAGWLCILAGAVVAAYLIHALYWTNLTTARAQEALLESFELEVGPLSPLTVAGDPPSADQSATLTDVDLGEAVAALEMFRPGVGPIVLDSPVMVVEGVTDDILQTGPGRYPTTARPGEWGNFAVAGHRTTYGAPFWDLDQAQAGDEIHVTDRNGNRWIYEVVESQIVPPSEVGVLARDPLARERPMLTLTTCHPRWSQSDRLVVFAELSEEQVPMAVAAGTAAPGAG